LRSEPLRSGGPLVPLLLGVFCISPRKGSIQDSSRLEDDPLPLLSVLIDNMHVDEVQIDGGGTEAVVIGNMGNPGKRLIVLEGGEVEALNGRHEFRKQPEVRQCGRNPSGIG
jgi:hypothetical protein